MSETSPQGRFHHCIRDLAALNALPSMCLGRTPAEALEIVMDALPTVLSCDLLHLTLPDGATCAVVRGQRLTGDALATLTEKLAREADEHGILEVAGLVPPHCLAAELPMGTLRGRLVVGKPTLALDTDRVLVRSAANLVGATLESANVLENAKVKDEFLAMLGHELRNPLAPILTAVELLSRRPEAARECEVIERQTRHLTRLVDDLLDISRVTRGHIELRREPVSLRSILERASEVVEPLISRHGHTFVAGDAGEVMLEGDAVRLAQVFGNLLTNAAKFTPPGGRIDLGIEATDERVRVSIRDNGRGIDLGHLVRIFEPFVQLDRVTDGSRGGLGLGLAIVKSLVERHGGTVTADSHGSGKGSAFLVDLPVHRLATPATEDGGVVPLAIASRGVRVLVVDDNVDNAELLGEALALYGFETSVVFDGKTALEAWERFSPHAAILDLGLPDIDGYELARTLRAKHGKTSTLIAATGYGQPSDRMRSADAGFDRHLVKPVSIEELVRELERLHAPR